MNLTEQEIQNLLLITGTHPTPEGISSPQGKVKIQLVNKLSQMLNEVRKPKEEKKEVKS